MIKTHLLEVDWGLYHRHIGCQIPLERLLVDWLPHPARHDDFADGLTEIKLGKAVEATVDG
jgi:hypothetical protein